MLDSAPSDLLNDSIQFEPITEVTTNKAPKRTPRSPKKKTTVSPTITDKKTERVDKSNTNINIKTKKKSKVDTKRSPISAAIENSDQEEPEESTVAEDIEKKPRQKGKEKVPHLKNLL